LAFAIRILSEPLSGLRLRLPEGRTTIGGASADLRAPLEDGDDIVLEVAAEGVALGRAAPCWIDGRAQTVDGALPLGVPVDLAGFVFILEHADAPIALRPVPARRAAVAPRPAAMRVRLAAIAATLLAVVFALAWFLSGRGAANGEAAKPTPDERTPARRWADERLKKKTRTAYRRSGMTSVALSWQEPAASRRLSSNWSLA
jgi:hypothetical protein